MLNQNKLKSILHYDPNTGIWSWLQKVNRSIIIGQEAGCLDNSTGYIRIRIDDNNYRANVLAWLYMTGEWPEEQIDHINRIKSDNTFINLREINQQQNSWNRGINKNNTSGYKGVYWDKTHNLWKSVIGVDKKYKSLGYFNNKHDAALAYNEAAIKYHKEFAVLNIIGENNAKISI